MGTNSRGSTHISPVIAHYLILFLGNDDDESLLVDQGDEETEVGQAVAS